VTPCGYAIPCQSLVIPLALFAIWEIARFSWISREGSDPPPIQSIKAHKRHIHLEICCLWMDGPIGSDPGEKKGITTGDRCRGPSAHRAVRSQGPRHVGTGCRDDLPVCRRRGLELWVSADVGLSGGHWGGINDESRGREGDGRCSQTASRHRVLCQYQDPNTCRFNVFAVMCLELIVAGRRSSLCGKWKVRASISSPFMDD
jgi:hypothetical protein